MLDAAVVGEQTHAGERVDVGAGHRAAVAEAAEVLRRIEAPAGERAEAADAPPAPARALRLRGVLEQPPAALAAERERGVEVAGLAVEVDRDHPHGTRGGP